LLPENLISTVNPLVINGAYISGISTSTNKIDASSKLITIELSDTSISSEKFLFPITPSNGAIIFLVLSFAITSPSFTFRLNLIGEIISNFSMLYAFLLIGIAVPKVSTLFSNFF